MRHVFALLFCILLPFSVHAADDAAVTANTLPADPLSAEVAKVLASEMNTGTDATVEEKVARAPAVIEKTAKADGLKDESEIPVLTKTPAKAAGEAHPLMRVFLSLGILGLIGLGIVMFSKWWAKTTKKDISNNKIRILTQHYLGPKKSLAIVRVAGESILIGITDQNISMLKSLSLLDDEEAPSADLPVSFKGALAHAETKPVASSKATARKIEDELDSDGEDFTFSHIKDKISSTVRGMRPL